MILGLDTSHYEPALDWKLAKAAGVQWMYSKASQGSEFIDRTIASHTSAAKAAGVMTAAYHFFMANVDGNVQANLFMKSINGLKFDLPHILDWEDGSVQGQKSAVQITRALTILQCMEHATGAIPWIYMGADLAQELKLPQVFAKYPLIIASYNKSLGATPIPWRTITAWQFTDSYKVAGVSPGHTVDANWFYGSQDALEALRVP